MPEVGQVLKYDDPFYSVIDSTTGRHTAKKHKYTDDAVVEEVRLTLTLTLTLTPTLTLTLTLTLGSVPRVEAYSYPTPALGGSYS